MSRNSISTYLYYENGTRILVTDSKNEPFLYRIYEGIITSEIYYFRNTKGSCNYVLLDSLSRVVSIGSYEPSGKKVKETKTFVNPFSGEMRDETYWAIYHVKHGCWLYFNEYGCLIREEFWNRDSLMRTINYDCVLPDN
jgi:hypothetical protein